jgi:hypothetical protein
MVERDAKQFAVIIASLAEVFSDKEPSKNVISLYWMALKEYTIEQIQKAASDIIQGRVYPSMPKPAEIIEAIRGTQGDRATRAWIDVLRAVRRIGTYESVKFKDPVIHAVIEQMGGWSEMGNMLVDDEKWKQKEFERLYPIMEARGNHPDYLPGRLEVSNEANGFIEHIGSPVLIGEFEQCEIKRLAN